MTKSKIRTIEQKRAKFAFDRVDAVNKGVDKTAGDYKSYVKKLPMLIKTNGLGQSLAFIKSKKKDGDAYDHLYKDISEWICNEDPKKVLELESKEDFLEKLISDKTDTYTYKTVTMEVLALLNWLRRFVDGEIKD